MKLSLQQREECINLASTHTKSTIAKMYSVPTHTINNLLVKHGVTAVPERRLWSDTERASLFKFLANHTHEEAAKKFKTNKSTIHNISYRYGIEYGYASARVTIREAKCQTINCGQMFQTRSSASKTCPKCKREANRLRVMMIRNPDKADQQLEMIQDSEAEARASLQRIACDNLLIKFGLTAKDINTVTSRAKNGRHSTGSSQHGRSGASNRCDSGG